ncbi:MAG: Coenzyme F420 hydrogenase/dehydrogenase, beta subunit C-terminal domain [Erysipelotrichaceae bacterium]|nr:Coenzyme F420 hydrogenase/dehydrogenase, beta subunit C-terminal domain [Erysipelotrichaceae bacterium]
MTKSVVDIALNKEKCCGCSSCKIICPVSAISMFSDEDGFLYPTIDGNKCINCGKCRIVCPVCESKILCSSKPNKLYCFSHSDTDIWTNSTSGGAFTAIIQELLIKQHDKDVYVCGAIFDGDRVVHKTKIIKSTYDLEGFHKSKYIQSDLGEAFKEISSILRQNNSFLVFAGTPCQVNSIHNVFLSQRDKMFLIDFVCHGVGSPLVFQKYCSEFYKKPISNYTFRVKRVIRHSLFEYFSKFTLSNRVVLRNRDPYNRLFLEQLINRKICNGHCPFRTKKRISDVTLGDYRNADRYVSCSDKPLFTDQKNYSMVIPNSSFGESIISNIGQFGNLLGTLTDGIDENPLYYKNLPGNDARDSFFEYFRNNGIKKAIKKYVPHYNLKKYSYLIHTLRRK